MACVSGPQAEAAPAPPAAPPPGAEGRGVASSAEAPLEPAGEPAGEEPEQPEQLGKRGPAPEPGELPTAKPRGDPAAAARQSHELCRRGRHAGRTCAGGSSSGHMPTGVAQRRMRRRPSS
jgi:hypothetical protein